MLESDDYKSIARGTTAGIYESGAYLLAMAGDHLQSAREYLKAAWSCDKSDILFSSTTEEFGINELD